MTVPTFGIKPLKVGLAYLMPLLFFHATQTPLPSAEPSATPTLLRADVDSTATGVPKVKVFPDTV